MYTHQIVTESVINKAKQEAHEAAVLVLGNDTSDSNGSEAWQAVKVLVKGNTKLANELKAQGMEKDYYWGWLFQPEAIYNNYFAEQAWVETFVKVLNDNDIPARGVERLL